MGSSSQKHASRNGVTKLFFDGIIFTRLGLPCYPIVLLSNEAAYFVQLLKEKLTPPSRNELWVTVCVPEPNSSEKIALGTVLLQTP
jgi:hypothetical protein